MKVREFRTNQGKINSNRLKAGSTPVNEASGKRFEEYVEASSRNMAVEELKRLLNDVDASGRELENKFTLDTLFKYKDAVSKFLSKAVADMLELKKYDYLSHGSSRDVFAVVRKVDSILEEMTCKFLTDQNDRLAILTLIGEVRGMLLDLFM